MSRSLFLVLAMAALVAGCTTSSVNMTYDKTRTGVVSSAAKDTVVVGSFVDRRGHGQNWLGAIRGGFGNPLKTLETPKPVSEVVRDAYVEGLRARGMLATDGEPTRELRVVVNQFDCNQYVRREAHIKFNVQLWDPGAGEMMYSKQIVVDNVDGSLLSIETGIFADVEDLRRVANTTLQQAVDQTLDNAAFQAALRGRQG